MRRYREAWWAELRAGTDGQNINRSSTWKLNNLWRAACAEAAAEDARRDGQGSEIPLLLQRAELWYQAHLAERGQ